MELGNGHGNIQYVVLVKFLDYCRLLKPFARTALYGLHPVHVHINQMRTNINQINKTFPKLAVERLAKVKLGDLGDLK